MNKIHTKVFGRKPGPIATKFIHNLGYVGIGVFLSKLFVMLFQLFAGRLLGPANYGNFTLIITLSEFMYIPMALVMTAMVKYLAEKEPEKNQIVTSSILISIASILVWFIIYFIFKKQFANLFHVPVSYFTIALFVTLSYIAWVFATKLAQGLNKMKIFSLLHFTRSLLTFIFVVFLFYFAGISIKYAILATFLGYIISSFTIIKDLITLKWILSKQWTKNLLIYGSILLIGSSFSIVLKDINKLFINAFLGAAELGIYQAYTTVTFGITNFLSAIFTTVFFPESSKRDKKLIWGKIKSLLKYSYLLFIFVIISAAPLIYLYGKNYPFSISYLLLLSLASSLIFVYYIFSWYVASFGTKGAKYTTIAIIMGSVFNVMLSYFLISRIKIYGAIIAIIASYALAMVYLVINIKYRLLKHENNIN